GADLLARGTVLTRRAGLDEDGAQGVERLGVLQAEGLAQCLHLGLLLVRELERVGQLRATAAPIEGTRTGLRAHRALKRGAGLTEHREGVVIAERALAERVVL